MIPKDHIDLARVVESAGVELRRQGSRHVALCPFHDENTPSFFVFDERRFKCFGCGESGDVIDFVQKQFGLSFQDALKHLGIEQGRRTPEMHRQIEQQKRKAELIKKFRKWENRYANYVGDLIFKTEKLMMNGIPPEDLDLYAPLLHELPVLEYHLDIIINGSDKKKFQLYKEAERIENFDLGEELQKKDLVSEVLSIVDLDPLTREQERNRISEKYNIRKSAIDQFIKEQKKQEKVGETIDIVKEDEPATERISGDKLLSTIKEVLLKYVILPKGVAEPISAWIVLTYCYGAFRILPLLGIVSPVKRCGKTTLLEVLQCLAYKGLTASNISPAAVFRTIEKYSPTLLVDEADTFLKDNEELRGVLNSGHTKASAYVVRVVGENHEPVKFSTWGPKAVAMIGRLPDTLHDRSVVVSLRRKAPGETVSRIDVDFENECDEIRRACRRWADDHIDMLKTAKPNIPVTNNDRMTDNWMPLLTIAEIAGGDWSELMRKSMLGMFDGTDDSIGPKLLKDIQDIFESQLAERIFSDDLVEVLTDKKESPWCDWNRGKGLTQNGLARLLKPFPVKSKTIRIGEDIRKGYELSSFEDAFKRYIPLNPPESNVTALQANYINGLDEKQSVTNNDSVTDEKQHNQLKLNDCYVVTYENGDTGRDINKDVPLWKQLKFENEESYLEMISK